MTRYVESHNVQTRLLFSGNLIKHPCFDQIRGTDAYRVAGKLTNTDFIMNNTFWVGVYPGMTDEMIDYMAKTERPNHRTKSKAVLRGSIKADFAF